MTCDAELRGHKRTLSVEHGPGREDRYLLLSAVIDSDRGARVAS